MHTLNINLRLLGTVVFRLVFAKFKANPFPTIKSHLSFLPYVIDHVYRFMYIDHVYAQNPFRNHPTHHQTINKKTKTPNITKLT